eukprot:jgi/Ulvmu1/10199/UM006_0155.1
MREVDSGARAPGKEIRYTCMLRKVVEYRCKIHARAPGKDACSYACKCTTDATGSRRFSCRQTSDALMNIFQWVYVHFQAPSGGQWKCVRSLDLLGTACTASCPETSRDDSKVNERDTDIS